jgi:hypothetical protein
MSGDGLRAALRTGAAHAAICADRADEATELRKRAEAAERLVWEADIALRVAQSRAERAEFERDLERRRADALRAAVEELRAGQALMARTR